MYYNNCSVTRTVLSQEIRQRIISAGFYVVRTREFNLTRNEVEQFYAEHAGRFFHNRLTTFMNRCGYYTSVLSVENFSIFYLFSVDQSTPTY